MKNNSSLIYSLVLLVGDFLALIAAFGGAYLIRGHLYSTPVAHPISAATFMGVLLILSPFWMLLFALLGLYNSSIYEKRFAEAGRLLFGSFLGLLFISSYAYASNRPVFPSKLVPVYGFILAFILLVVVRTIIRSTRSTLFSYGFGITNLLLVGNTRVSSELVASLADSRISGYNLVGIVANKGATALKFPHLPHFATFEEAMQKIRAADIHAIVQTELFASGEKNNQILEFAQTNHIAYRFVPGNSELFVGNIAVELFRGSVPVIAVHQTALFGWGRVAKRAFDIFFSGLLIIITSPIMVLAAFLNLVTTGSIFFRQDRLTRFNEKFRVFKFRSQYKKYDGTTPEEAFVLMGKPELAAVYRKNGDYLENDPRITPLGRFWRRTSIDELAQLFNVIKGDLSLVGPRALIPEELNKYGSKHIILSVKSGLTGLAQVSGRRDITYDERRKLDLYYVQNWSLWMDIMIMLKTIRVVFNTFGAK